MLNLVSVKPNGSANDPREKLLGIVDLEVLSRLVITASSLEIVKYVNTQPIHISELARLIKCDETNLYRMMAVLASHGIFQELENKTFIGNETSNAFNDLTVRQFLEFRSKIVDSNCLRHYETGIRTGQSLIYAGLGVNFFDYFASSEELEATYQRQVAILTAWEVDIPKYYDFNNVSTVVDIGGGRGGFLKGLLESCSNIQSAVLFDLSEVEPNVYPELLGNSKFKFQSGNFFKTVDCRADIFTAALVFHCFNDSSSVAILSNIAAAMKSSGQSSKLLLIEPDLDVALPNEPHRARYFDMMLMFAGGRARRLADWRELTKQAGLTVRRKIPIQQPTIFFGAFAIFECQIAGNSEM